MNANLYRYEQLSVEQLEAMRNSGTYITPTEESKSDSGEYKLTDETFDISAEDRDRINRMYIGAYTLLDDQRKIMYYALELQKSKEPSMVELGWYTEARAMRDLNLDGWQDQYGGVLQGIKLLQTEPGFVQNPLIHWLPEHLFTHPEYRDCHLLYYTGITRTAKGILAEIVRSMFPVSYTHLTLPTNSRV